jgi:hypothetical protein
LFVEDAKAESGESTFDEDIFPNFKFGVEKYEGIIIDAE